MPNKKNWTIPPDALNLVAERFKILAEPLRLRILQSLQAAEEMSVGDITITVESTQPNVSKHLKILQDAGLVSRRQEGNTVFYRISDDSIFELCELVCNSLKERYESRVAVFG